MLVRSMGLPQFDDSKQEKLALQVFVQDLQPEQFREHIRLSAPGSLAAALDKLETLCAPGRPGKE